MIVMTLSAIGGCGGEGREEIRQKKARPMLKEHGGTCHGEFVADLYERCNVWEEGRLRYDML